jgi:DNA polymerase-3 subunit delta
MAKARARGGVHAILGPDSFLAEETLERLLVDALGSEREGAVQALHGDEATWARLVETARTGSLFVASRAIVVRGAEALKGDDEAIAAYLDDPSPDVTLVLMAVKPDKRRSAWKKVTAKATVHPADPKKGPALRNYVADHLRRRGLRFEPGALEELIERVGQDLRRLMGEIDKLEAFVQGQRGVTAEDVAAVSGRGMARPLYRLGDAIALRDAPSALVFVEELLESGEEGPLILGTLHRSLRQMRGVLALREARVSQGEMAERLKLPGNMTFKLPSLVDASRNWSEADLGRAIQAVARADRRIKTGTDARIALLAAIAEACRPARGKSGTGGARPSLPPGR